jgi:hypothetical protein
MNMAKAPLALVKEKFGDKTKLVEAVKAFAADTNLWLGHTNHETLDHVSNSKLLKLHATFTAVKSEFGSREKLVDAILGLENRAKDAGYKARLMGFPVPRLFDAYKATKKRAAAAKKA